MKTLRPFLFVLLPIICFAGCMPDLVVKKLDVTWNAGNKRAEALIANIGNKDAGEFMVYFNGDEDPVSPDRRPQVSHLVPSLAKGATIPLAADFAPLAHPINNKLGNIYQITVLVDPKNMVRESNENNNKKSAPVFKVDSKFVFHVVRGNAGVSGIGSQGPAGNNVTFSVDLETGWTLFEDYAHVTFGSLPPIPASLTGTTIRLVNGVGRYDFMTGNFSDIQFVVQVEDTSGRVTTATHSFSGGTAPALSVPVGGSQPTGSTLKLSLVPPFSIDLGNGLFGNVELEADFVSAIDL